MRYIIGLGVLLALVVALTPLVSGILDGSIPPPDAQMFQRLSEAVGQTGMVVVAAVIAIIFVLAALAPVVYAMRANDPLTVVISIVLVGITWTLVFVARTSIDTILAALIYLASMVLSVVVFAAKHIANQQDAIKSTES